MADLAIESVKPFRFLDLPSELRIAIYEMVVRPEPHIHYFSNPAYQTVTRNEFRGHRLPKLEAQLLRTCRQINKEASDVLYCGGARFHAYDGLLTFTDHNLPFVDSDSITVEIPRSRIVHLTIYIFIQEVGPKVTCDQPLPPPPLSALKSVHLAVVGTASRFNDTVPTMPLGKSLRVIQNEILCIMELLPAHVAVEAEQGVRDNSVFQYVDDFRLDRVYPTFSSSPTLLNVLQVDAEVVSNAIAMHKSRQGAGLVQGNED